MVGGARFGAKRRAIGAFCTKVGSGRAEGPEEPEGAGEVWYETRATGAFCTKVGSGRAEGPEEPEGEVLRGLVEPAGS